jgi:soluble lytic murein transglycosylase-like protein
VLTKHTYSVPVLLIALAVPATALAASGHGEAPGRIGLSAARPAGLATLTRPVERFHRAIHLSVHRIRASRRARLTAEHRQRREAFATLPGGVSQSTLDAIGACESGGDPTAVSAGGTYRGKYQFDYGTWESVGGTGDPAAAPEAEQDYRAALLYSEAGSSPWPICG